MHTKNSHFSEYRYEISNNKGGGESLTDPNTVFRRRAGDAVGYCNLFATMCK